MTILLAKSNTTKQYIVPSC